METKQTEEKIKGLEKRIQSLEKGYYTIIIVNVLTLVMSCVSLILRH